MAMVAGQHARVNEAGLEPSGPPPSYCAVVTLGIRQQQASTWDACTLWDENKTTTKERELRNRHGTRRRDAEVGVCRWGERAPSTASRKKVKARSRLGKCQLKQDKFR